MGTPPLSNEKLIAAMAAFREAGTIAGGARLLGMNEHTFRHQVEQARERGFVRELPPPEPGVPIQDLIDRMCADYERSRDHADATKLVKVNVTVDGPFGLMVFGDPHLGSPKTNWPALRRDVDLVKNTKALFGVNIGDTADNWSGKLAHLWSEMEISHTSERKLSRWFLEEIPWLLWLHGNHDLWTGPGCPIKWLAQQLGVIESDWSQRLALIPPSGRETRIGVYHGARGHSMWNAVHGGIRTARLGARDHLVCAGHIHRSQVLYPVVDPGSGEWASILQVGSYKDLPDSYGKRLGGSEENAFPSAVVIINPHARTPAGHVKIYADTEEGADILTFKRKRWAQARSADV